jgi:hypothetical protein
VAQNSPVHASPAPITSASELKWQPGASCMSWHCGSTIGQEDHQHQPKYSSPHTTPSSPHPALKHTNTESQTLANGGSPRTHQRCSRPFVWVMQYTEPRCTSRAGRCPSWLFLQSPWCNLTVQELCI